MPWTTDENGERKYKVSLYAKEELPTWNEVYEWISGENALVYDPTDKSQELDPYWKIPVRKYRLATICNQFNKMLFEDGMYQSLIDKLSQDSDPNIYSNILDIRFVLEMFPDPDTIKKMGLAKSDIDGVNIYNDSMNKFIKEKSLGDPSTPPPIYTIPLPNGERNPFITNDFPRINVNDLDMYPLCIVPVMKIGITGPTDTDIKGAFCLHMSDPRLTSMLDKKQASISYANIISFMIRPFQEYFENGVGWKDENGKLIEREPDKPLCQGVGVDPAL